MAEGMRYRELGSTGIKISVVGLGTFAIGGWFWGGTDDKKATEAINASLDSGVNLIDTAPMYGFGHAEQVVGKAIRGRRDKVILATKVGLRWDLAKGEFDGYASEKSPSSKPSQYEIYRYLGPESIRYEVEQSLVRLKTDYIDLYQTHWQDKTTPIESTMEALLKLREEGKIRAIGVSNVSREQLQEYGTVASAQEKYSLMDRHIEKNGLLDFCIQKGVSILSYFTMEQGLLTGKASPTRQFKEGDTRKGNPSFAPENVRRINGIIEQLAPFGEKYRASVPQIVIALTAQRRGITSVLLGARDRTQAEENSRGGWMDPKSEDIVAMNGIVDQLTAFAHP